MSLMEIALVPMNAAHALTAHVRQAPFFKSVCGMCSVTSLYLWMAFGGMFVLLLWLWREVKGLKSGKKTTQKAKREKHPSAHLENGQKQQGGQQSAEAPAPQNEQEQQGGLHTVAPTQVPTPPQASLRQSESCGWVYMKNEDSMFVSNTMGVVHLVSSCQHLSLSKTTLSICSHCLRTVLKKQGGKLKVD